MADDTKNTGKDPQKGKSIWDNDLPPGDSPPLPRWPLTASIVAYSIWMVFLISMLIMRLTTTA